MPDETPTPPRPSAAELKGAAWYKASKSNTGTGCVEVAHMSDYTAVRDSKNPDGPVLLYTPHEWECFLDGALNGEMNRP